MGEIYLVVVFFVVFSVLVSVLVCLFLNNRGESDLQKKRPVFSGVEAEKLFRALVSINVDLRMQSTNSGFVVVVEELIDKLFKSLSLLLDRHEDSSLCGCEADIALSLCPQMLVSLRKLSGKERLAEEDSLVKPLTKLSSLVEEAYEQVAADNAGEFDRYQREMAILVGEISARWEVSR